MNVKYYLIVNENSLGKLMSINNKKEFEDITELDLITEKYSREDLLKFLGYIPKNQKELDIYIMRVQTKKGNLDIKFYDCIFNSSRIDLSPIQEHRLKKIQEGSKNIRIDDCPEFEKITNKVVTNIVIDRNGILSPMIHRKNILEPPIQDFFTKTYQENKAQNIHMLFRNITSYKTLRGLYVEYLKSKELRDTNKLPYVSDRYHASYDSACFGYTDSFNISIDNARNDKNKSFFTDYRNQILSKYTLEELAIIEEMNRHKFDNDTLADLYRKGGVEYVMKNMDTNELYSCSKKDLVKLGIIPMNDYIKERIEAKRKY